MQHLCRVFTVCHTSRGFETGQQVNGIVHILGRVDVPVFKESKLYLGKQFKLGSGSTLFQQILNISTGSKMDLLAHLSYAQVEL